MTEPNSDAEAFAKAQADEYGTYRATGPIYFDGVLAFNAGHPVPVSHVKAYGYDKQKLVEKVPASEQPARSTTTEKG